VEEKKITVKTSRQRAHEVGRGRAATSPLQIPLTGLRDVLWRVYRGISRDRVSANAAGAAFFLILAIVPALAALVSLYGLAGDPAQLRERLDDLQGFLPPTLLELMDSELERLIQQRTDLLSVTFATTFAFAIYIVNSAVQGLFDALNVIYGEREKRGFLKLYGVSLIFTFAGLIFVILLLNAVIGVPLILGLLPLGPLAGWIVTILPSVALFILANIGIAALYRYGPSRAPAMWRWISPGSIAAAFVWIVVSAAFSYYLTVFANYSATYGSLGAIAAAMMWAYISTFILLVGAELDAELEHQTARDTTVSPERPLGRRGAVVADSVGRSRKE
jgi:membrane protein